MLSEVNIHEEGSLWLRLCRKCVLQNVGGSEWFDPRNDLVLGGVVPVTLKGCPREAWRAVVLATS